MDKKQLSESVPGHSTVTVTTGIVCDQIDQWGEVRSLFLSADGERYA